MSNQMLSARGFSAWITTDGEPLPVYQIDTTDTTCSAWIPSNAGQAFSVWWKDDSKARIATSGHVFIDGHDVASAILRPGRTKPVERAGAKASARSLRPFRFTVLRLTDDETLATQDDPTLSDMGIIKVEISRVKLGDEVPFKGYEAQDPGFVHERAKKLGAHCTSYGPTTRTKASRTVAVSTAPYDPDTPGPYVTFIFRYKSRDILCANGIIKNGERKRSSPGADEAVVEISDSESENDTPKAPASKRVRVEVDEPSSDQANRREPLDNKFAIDDLCLGTPNLLLPEPGLPGSSAAEESQTEAGFDASSALLREDIEQTNENVQIGGISQSSEVEDHAVE